MTTLNTLYDLLHNSVEKFADKVAFSMFGGEDVTYKEFGQRVKQVQEMLLDAGLTAGDKVVILSSSMPNWGVCYFAVVTGGMIAVPILPDFTGEELDTLIKHSEAKGLLVSDKLFTKLSKDIVSTLNVVIRTKNLGIISQNDSSAVVEALPMRAHVLANRIELMPLVGHGNKGVGQER